MVTEDASQAPRKTQDIEIIPVGDGPHSVAVSLDGTRLYATNYLSGSVSVIDTSRNTVVAGIRIGVGLYGVAVNPDGARLRCR